MQQPLLKNLLSEPEAAFWCVSVHGVFGFISRFTGSRFWLHQLNFFYSVGRRLTSPGVIHPFWSWCSKGCINVTQEQGWEARTWVFSHVPYYRFPVWPLAHHLVLLKVTQCPPTMGKKQSLGSSVCIFNMDVTVVCPNKSGYTYFSTGHARKMQCEHIWKIAEGVFWRWSPHSGSVLQWAQICWTRIPKTCLL